MFYEDDLLNDRERKEIADAASPGAPGIRVLSPEEVTRIVHRCKRHLARLEETGRLPRRRLIGLRRTGYFVHELKGLDSSGVVVRDPRTLGRREVAEKLSVTEKTVTRMVQEGDLPAPTNGRWRERDIDAWLLRRPKV